VANAQAKRHYTCQSSTSDQFVPPGRCLVLRAVTATGQATWVTSWPMAEYVKHGWPGAWVCSLFRNEGAGLSSELIREAVAATRAHWPDAPVLGMVTMVDATKTRHKRDPGRCFRRAGFRVVGSTKAQGLIVLQLLPAEMPPPMAAIGSQETLAL
jgi:hypothetical protein